MTERMWVSVGNAPANRAAGAVFGVFKGAVLIGCAVLMLRTFVPVPVDPAATAGKLRGPLADLNTRVADSLFAARLADLTSGLFSTIVNAAEVRLRMLATGHSDEP
jgi:uncharacterized membrane protein required for colicin V production